MFKCEGCDSPQEGVRAYVATIVKGGQITARWCPFCRIEAERGMEFSFIHPLSMREVLGLEPRVYAIYDGEEYQEILIVLHSSWDMQWKKVHDAVVDTIIRGD